MMLGKALTIMAVVFSIYVLGLYLLEGVVAVVRDVEAAYRLAERADLDYEKTVQDTAEDISRLALGVTTGEEYNDYVYPGSMGMAIMLIERAQRLKVNTGWFASFGAIYLVASRAGAYIVPLAVVALFALEMRYGRAQERRLNEKGCGYQDK